MTKQGIHFDRNQLDFLKSAKGKLAKASAQTVSQVGQFAYKKIIENVSYQAFTHEELERMDHPYARRHGSIQSKAIGARPRYAVGKDTGNFAQGIHGQTTNQYEYAITYSSDTHIQRIVQGTKVMLPRDPIGETVSDKKFQSQLKQEMQTTFNKKVKGNE